MKVLNGRALIRRDEAEETTESGFILSKTALEPPQTGTIIEVATNDEGLTKGDKVLFTKYGAIEVAELGENTLLVDVEDILAVINE